MASRLSARRAVEVLRGEGWAKDRAARAGRAIEAHSFSAGIAPDTLEARVLQDADRLDAIGHVGIARCFYVSGRLGRALYHPEDPRAEARRLDDMAFAADHFQTKLLRLAEGFQTATGRRLAAARHEVLKGFFEGLMAEAAPG